MIALHPDLAPMSHDDLAAQVMFEILNRNFRGLAFSIFNHVHQKIIEDLLNPHWILAARHQKLGVHSVNGFLDNFSKVEPLMLKGETAGSDTSHIEHIIH